MSFQCSLVVYITQRHSPELSAGRKRQHHCADDARVGAELSASDGHASAAASKAYWRILARSAAAMAGPISTT